MRWKAWALIRLEHAIAKRVLFGQLEIGKYFRGIYVFELRVGRRTAGGVLCTANSNLVGPVHFPTVVHFYESSVAVIEVVIIDQRRLCKRDRLPNRICSAVGD